MHSYMQIYSICINKRRMIVVQIIDNEENVQDTLKYTYSNKHGKMCSAKTT